eukprot:CAMPEP_0181345156 /NCGR_PEP_ID=MMETSP1101-20121128/32596_1 /TAXON_ID=46948 /ORGANISM="Rhodomonas abbreviata, Strain Caron Lab Isolate" /LENGTH=76 /DNA_ID=CAMNT_0023457087 /DNA_START=39 /DNA_END=266 /DNA_ORIENTATION=+
MNWNRKGYCDPSHNATLGKTSADKEGNRMWQRREWYNNRAACESNGFVWYEVSHADNLILANNSFVCAHTQFSRAN